MGYSPWGHKESDATEAPEHPCICVCIYIFIYIVVHLKLTHYKSTVFQLKLEKKRCKLSDDPKSTDLESS